MFVICRHLTGCVLVFVTFAVSCSKKSLKTPGNPSPPVSPAGDVVDIYQREFLALRERLHSAEQENLRRSKELNLVLEEIKRAIAEKQALRDINRTWSSLSGQYNPATAWRNLLLLWSKRVSY